MLMTKLRGALRSATIWVNGLLLAALPFADSLAPAMVEYLPELAPYLPADMYKALAVAGVLFNIYQRARTTMSLEEKGAK